MALAVAADRWVLRTRLLGTRDFWVTYAILLFFQLLTNGVLTRLRIVRYRPASILGLRVAYAPVEDLAFGFALITITLCCWARLAAALTTKEGDMRNAVRLVPGPTDHVVVIGAGLGGLSAALRLLGAGRDVTVLEQAAGPGGRAGVLRQDGYQFDTGPTV